MAAEELRQGDGLRLLCVGTLAGGVAGLLFGLAAELIQSTIDQALIARLSREGANN